MRGSAPRRRPRRRSGCRRASRPRPRGGRRRRRPPLPRARSRPADCRRAARRAWPFGSRGRLVRRCRMRPTLRTDLVHRVEQDQILHVGVLLEHRRRERKPGRAVVGEGRARRRGGLAVFGADETLALELAQQPPHCVADLVAGGLVPRPELDLDVVLSGTLLDRLPDRRPGVPEAVVRARLEVDEDDLALDRFVDYVRAVHPKTRRHVAAPSSPLRLSEEYPSFPPSISMHIRGDTVSYRPPRRTRPRISATSSRSRQTRSAT